VIGGASPGRATVLVPGSKYRIGNEFRIGAPCVSVSTRRFGDDADRTTRLVVEEDIEERRAFARVQAAS
jgi:hypothetical protein